MENMYLARTVQSLIDLGKEGDYWDFKREFTTKAAFIHDVLCLANESSYKGDRYLVFGVNNDRTLAGIKFKHTQANIIDILRNANFSSNTFPDVYLKDITLSGKEITILIIKDKPEDRPYYLEKSYTSTKQVGNKTVTVNAGAIYTRIRDSNTPIDATASRFEVEKMWRQRFGIDSTPLERITQYLLDFDGWEKREEDDEEGIFWYYKSFPEFTIHRPAESKKKVEAHESWVRYALAPNSEVYNLDLKYHQTVLHREILLSYDDWQEYYPVPRNTRNASLTKFGDESSIFYYYLVSDVLKFNILQFFQKRRLCFESQIEGGRVPPPLIIFKDENEVGEFIGYLNNSYDKSGIKNFESRPNSEFQSLSKEADLNRISLCLFVCEKLPEWRASLLS